MADPDDYTLKQAFAQIEAQKQLLQRAKQHAGQLPAPNLRRSRQQLDMEFNMIASQINFGHGRHQNISSAFIGEAYPPCTLPLASLEPILLKELRLETHHRGRVLVVRTFSQPNRMTSIQNAVEDVDGNVERLAVYNVLPTVLPDELLGCGTVVAIKEPYFKRTGDGGLFVRVDHPTDLIVVHPRDALMPKQWAPMTSKAVDIEMLKARGNAAFGKKQWEQADAAYTEAIDAFSAPKDDLVLWKTLLRNRAAARLRLGRYEFAVQDALAGMVDDPVTKADVVANGKALYRAGQAAYDLGDFEQAKPHFEAGLKLHEEHGEAAPPEIVDGHQRTEKRLAEQATGEYDWSSITASVTRKNFRLDQASFLKKTRVGPSDVGTGQGLFVTEPVKAGDVVFVEKAFHVVHADEDTSGYAMQMTMNLNSNRVTTGAHCLLLYGLTDKLQWNPTLARQFFCLYDGLTGQKEVAVVDGRLAVDTFRVQAIVELNGFHCPGIKTGHTIEEEYDSTGIWRHAAKANHACLPNARRSFVGDLMVVRAVRDLKAGDEVLLTYTTATDLLETRQKKMRDHYGFTCGCALCAAEKTVASTAMANRARLIARANSFIEKNTIPVDSKGSILLTYRASKALRTEATKLRDSIAATYPADIYASVGLPLLACGPLDLWLAHTAKSIMKGPPTQNDIDVFLGMLRRAGYNVTLDDKAGTVNVDRTHAFPRMDVVHFALHLRDTVATQGCHGVVASLEKLAEDVYVTCRGTKEEYENWLR
ncbi:hypothetical protein SEUCBS139899_001952 [Sporothrix eucalyptigena]